MERQVGQKSPDFLSTHVLGMTLTVKHNKTFCPSNVGVFGAGTQMLETQYETHLVEQLGFWLHKDLQYCRQPSQACTLTYGRTRSSAAQYTQGHLTAVCHVYVYHHECIKILQNTAHMYTNIVPNSSRARGGINFLANAAKSALRLHYAAYPRKFPRHLVIRYYTARAVEHSVKLYSMSEAV